MTNTELIDRLCSLLESQAEIIREQAFYIEQVLDVDEAVREKYADLRKSVEGGLESIESCGSLFPGCGGEE